MQPNPDLEPTDEAPTPQLGAENALVSAKRRSGARNGGLPAARSLARAWNALRVGIMAAAWRMRYWLKSPNGIKKANQWTGVAVASGLAAAGLIWGGADGASELSSWPLMPDALGGGGIAGLLHHLPAAWKWLAGAAAMLSAGTGLCAYWELQSLAVAAKSDPEKQEIEEKIATLRGQERAIAERRILSEALAAQKTGGGSIGESQTPAAPDQKTARRL